MNMDASSLSLEEEVILRLDATAPMYQLEITPA